MIVEEADFFKTMIHQSILFLYIKSKEFHTYSCAYVIILIISILLSNLIRVIQVSDDEKLLK